MVREEYLQKLDEYEYVKTESENNRKTKRHIYKNIAKFLKGTVKKICEVGDEMSILCEKDSNTCKLVMFV